MIFPFILFRLMSAFMFFPPCNPALLHPVYMWVNFDNGSCKKWFPVTGPCWRHFHYLKSRHVSLSANLLHIWKWAGVSIVNLKNTVLQEHRTLCWREPTGSWSPALQRMVHTGIKPVTLAVLARCSYWANSRASVTLSKTERILQVCRITFPPVLSFLIIFSLLEYLGRKFRMTHRKGGTGNFVDKTRTTCLQRGKVVSDDFSHKQSTYCVIAIYLKWLWIFNSLCMKKY